MLLGDPADHLLDEHGLADAGAAEQADLPALEVGTDEVEHLDPGLEDLLLGFDVLERRRLAMDRPAGLAEDSCRARRGRRPRC